MSRYILRKTLKPITVLSDDPQLPSLTLPNPKWYGDFDVLDGANLKFHGLPKFHLILVTDETGRDGYIIEEEQTESFFPTVEAALAFLESVDVEYHGLPN